MYKEYYHLKAEPFSTHPNTGTFFVSETHKQAWYYLLFGIDTQEPFLVLTGDYGMGKTLLCLRLIKFLKEKGMSRVEYIPTSNEGYGGVLRRIAMGMGISPLPQDEEILQDMIYDSFRADTDKKRFYLIIDDVHELDLTFLTKLKYLSTFNHDEFFPVIMIFVGHPSFLQDLRTPALNSLNQRIKRRYNLAVFDLEDTKNYIYFRLLKSGATGIPAFPAETIQKIFTYSGGGSASDQQHLRHLLAHRRLQATGHHPSRRCGRGKKSR
jgi:type II secretory pathway predicted ATPase ExeA